MVFPSFNRFPCVASLFLGFVLTCHAALGLAREGGESGIFRSLEGINSIPMGEPADSHGTLGLSLGAGASLHTLGEMDSQRLRELGFAEGVGRELLVPRLWLSKGLPIPVDVGLSVGASQMPIFQQATGYLQWTMFEGLGLPSLAMRLSHSRLFMARSTNLTANQGSFAASWSFLRYVTVFGTTSVVLHNGETDRGANGGLSLAGGATADPAAIDSTSIASSWMERTASMGVRLTLIPPFVSLTAEVVRRGDEVQSAMAKLAMGL